MSTEIHDQLASLQNEMLEPLVRQLVNDLTACVARFRFEPIQGGGGASYFGVCGLYRVHGVALMGSGHSREWSLILKAFDGGKAGASSVPSSWNFWKREIMAYQSDALRALPNGLRAARCVGIWAKSATIIWLWLEDVPGASTVWSLDDFGAAAWRLGAFNGAFFETATQVREPWFSRNQVTEWYPFIGDIVTNTLKFSDTAVARRAFLAGDHERSAALWHNHRALVAAFSQLPECLSHQDAHRRNLMINGQDRNVTAIDWAMLGYAPIGAEAGTLTAMSLRFLDFPAEQARLLDQMVFDNYVDGLRASGWRGDRRKIRLAYAVNAYVLCGVAWMLGNLESMTVPENAQNLARMIGHPFEEFLEQSALVQRFLLELAEEAYSLL